jgi:acyl carrier protein
MKQVIRNVVTQVAKQNIRDDQTLVSSGIIDSLSILRLISGLERELSIVIPKRDVQPEDFDSVDVIVDTIERIV